MRIELTPEGIFLPQIGLWLDPARDSEAAWISHAHRDHARGTHGRVIATPETAEWNGARLTAHPAGHMLGAAQLLIEFEGERVLYTGHVKLRPPIFGAEYETVPCDRLIVESTFGLPIFHFLSREEARERIHAFARECFEQKLTPVYLAHPLGRAQEVAHALSEAGIPIAADAAVARYIPAYERHGCRIEQQEPGAAVVAPRGFRAGKGFRAAYVSGRAALDNARARAGAEELIPYSDHADFEELLAIVEATGAREVDVVHGYTEAFTRILKGR